VAEYTAWIDGFAAGIGDLPAVVILEPDGLGIIPWYTNLDGNLEWCQPAEANPATAADDRFPMLDYAVDPQGTAQRIGTPRRYPQRLAERRRYQ
jgi:endoglucanase